MLTMTPRRPGRPRKVFRMSTPAFENQTQVVSWGEQVAEIHDGTWLVFGHMQRVSGGNVRVLDQGHVDLISGGYVRLKQRTLVERVTGGMVYACDRSRVQELAAGLVQVFDLAHVDRQSGGTMITD